VPNVATSNDHPNDRARCAKHAYRGQFFLQKTKNQKNAGRRRERQTASRRTPVHSNNLGTCRMSAGPGGRGRPNEFVAVRTTAQPVSVSAARCSPPRRPPNPNPDHRGPREFPRRPSTWVGRDERRGALVTLALVTPALRSGDNIDRGSLTSSTYLLCFESPLGDIRLSLRILPLLSIFPVPADGTTPS